VGAKTQHGYLVLADISGYIRLFGMDRDFVCLARLIAEERAHEQAAPSSFSSISA